ncbi:MAG TPA: methionyl-tRNA formyltransferase [Gemmatimonadaceae bacterium]
MRVLFWGTPEFATPALRALLGEGFDVVGVVTQPDKPVGRSRSQLQGSPVKAVAMAEGVPVLQPVRPRGADFAAQVSDLAPDLSVVVAYGHILPLEILELPSKGTLNIHASLLPLLRGAAPIQAALREGHAKSGVTIMRMVLRLDAGPIILQLPTEIAEDETGGELSLRLAELGATALIEALALLEMGQAREIAQDDAVSTYASKIDRDTTRIDWTTDALSVSRVIRAYDPKPAAWSNLAGKDIKLFGARAEQQSSGAAPGEVISAGADGMLVACGSGAVRILQAQPSGQRRLAVADWARGRGVSKGQRFA